MRNAKIVLAVLGGEATIAGLVILVRAYGQHMYYQGRIDTLLDGAA